MIEWCKNTHILLLGEIKKKPKNKNKNHAVSDLVSVQELNIVTVYALCHYCLLTINY